MVSLFTVSSLSASLSFHGAVPTRWRSMLFSTPLLTTPLANLTVNGVLRSSTSGLGSKVAWPLMLTSSDVPAWFFLKP